MKQWVGRCAAVGFAAALLSGCAEKPAENAAGSDSATTQTVTIDFWHYFTGEHDKAIKALVAEFEQKNPDIKVKTVFQGNPPELSKKLISSIATSKAGNPVLATVYENWTSDYVSKNFLQPVEEHFTGPDGLTPEEQADFVKVFADANKFNGKWTTMPFNKSIYLMYYNADMLTAKGVTTAPASLEDFRTMIAKTMVEADGRVGTYGFGARMGGEIFTTLYFACGGSYTDAAGNITINNPSGVAALKFLSELQSPKKQMLVNSDYMNSALGSGQIASFIYSSASFPFTEKSVGSKFKWDVAAVPGTPPAGSSKKYLMQGTNIGIFANKSDAEKKAAWKFLKFLTSVESQVTWATRSGYMPIRYSMLKDERMKKYLDDNPRYAKLANLVLTDQGQQEPKEAQWEGMREIITQMVDRVLNGGSDPIAELQKTEEALKAKWPKK